MIEWACTLLQARGDVDDGERIWYAATIALAGGVRDWTFLVSPVGSATKRAPDIEHVGHVEHALARAPDDPRLRLARAVALASRYQVGVEMEAPHQGRRTGPAPDAMVLILPPMVELRRGVSLESAMQQFRDLIADPVVGAEARLRLAYLLWRRGDYAGALDESRAAAAAAQDADVRYLAWFIAAQAAQPLGHLDQAEDLLAAALAARPHSQSASLGLAALRFLRGEADAAYALVERTRANRPVDDDPWRMFLYGDFARLPGLVEQLRTAVRP